jgi:hypothetical protein
MRPDEHLAWMAHPLMGLEAADGTERTLRERDGAWVAEHPDDDDAA